MDNRNRYSVLPGVSAAMEDNGESQVFTRKIDETDNTRPANAQAGQNGGCVDIFDPHCGDTVSGTGTDDSDGAWSRVQRNSKRPRISTCSSTSTQPPHVNDFESLSVDGKLSALFAEVSGVNNKVDKCVEIHSRVEHLEGRLDDQSTRITQLEYRSLDLEARSRRNNLIFGGIKENANENCAVVIANFLRNNLDIGPCPPIPRVHRLGRFHREKTRPIIAFFLDTRDADHVVSKAKMLKGTRYSINRDYPQEISQARKELWPTFKDIRSAYPQSRVSLAYPAKIIRDGKVVADKFPRWNTILHGSRLPAEPVYSNTQQGQAQGARAEADRSRAESRGPNNGPVAHSSMNSGTRRESRSPASSRRSRDHAPRRHAPSREKRGSRRASVPPPPSDSAIRRPWVASPPEPASQSLLQDR